VAKVGVSTINQSINILYNLLDFFLDHYYNPFALAILIAMTRSYTLLGPVQEIANSIETFFRHCCALVLVSKTKVLIEDILSLSCDVK